MPTRPSTHTTQYFEILGNRAIYHDGWIASCFHGRAALGPLQAAPVRWRAETWELYDIATIFSQATDLAAARTRSSCTSCRSCSTSKRRKYDVYPLERPTNARVARQRPSSDRRRDHTSPIPPEAYACPRWPSST